MKFFFITLLSVSALSFVACRNTTNESSVNQEVISSEVAFGSSSQEFLKLNDGARELVRQWPALEDVMKEIQDMNGSHLAALRNKTEILQRSADSLAMRIPEEFNTQIIRSRILVLKTRTELLSEMTRAESINTEELQGSMVELNASLNNLLLQLNEKLEKDRIDIQRTTDEESELKKQNHFKDSVFQLELRDKHNKNTNQ